MVRREDCFRFQHKFCGCENEEQCGLNRGGSQDPLGSGQVHGPEIIFPKCVAYQDGCPKKRDCLVQGDCCDRPGATPVDPNYEGPIYEDVDHHTLANEAMKDEIKRPDHYACYPIEPITFIMMNDLPFCAGNVVKYVCRAGRKSKDPREDIRKAMRYCEMWIEMLDREEAGTDGAVIGRPL